MTRPVKMIDGYSESLWKSVVVKSLRIGWPAGLEEASRRLNKSTMKSLLICGLFEDVFPPEEELQEAMDEVNRFDFEALCSRETHHGQGLYTPYHYTIPVFPGLLQRRFCRAIVCC